MDQRLQTFENIFEPALLAEMESKGSFLSLPEGSALLDMGQAIHVVPIVLSGTVKVSRLDEEGHELLLYYISPKESCAMTFTCCMQLHASEIKAVTEESTEVLAIPVRIMEEWMSKYPSWKNYVMSTIRNRFNELLKNIDQIAFQKLDERLIYYLKEKSKATGSSLVNLSHEQVAQELASSREVISRLLKKLEKDKKVLLYRNQIKLLQAL